MDSIVSFIVTPVVESLLVPVKKHLGYWFSTTKHVADMHTKMEKLNGTRSNVEDYKKSKESNSLKVPAEVPGWLDEVEKIESQVKSIDSTNGGSCFNIKARHKLGREACNIVKEINRLMEDKSNIVWTDIPIPPAQVSSTSTPLSDYTNFKSRDTIYLKALNALKPDNTPHMIGLCGMGGVGKTKMTEKLKKVVSEKAMFDFIVEVAIGENMDVSIIQKAIAEKLAIRLNESDKEVRASKLRNAFKAESDNGKKKFLVILDDIWQMVDLKDIGLSPKPDQGIDFKVLLTSRDQNVCIQMGVELDSILNLDVINNSEAEDFFFQFVNISDDGDLHKIGCDITIICHGLPIAIKTIALTLKGQIKDVWEDTLSKLKYKGIDEVTSEIFAISYQHLRDEETRLTLLLCGLFPEDFDTPREDLVRYSYGLKLFADVYTIRETRNRLNTCIERLIHANFLIRSQKVGCVKMHDLVRAFVLDVSSKSEHSTIVGNMSKWPAEPRSEFCKKISLTCTGMDDFPTSPFHPNLLLLKLMHADESLRFSKNFYKEMKNLEVIAYDNMKYPLNLRSLQCSSNLRTLCLHKCSLMSDCSSIGNLLNLEVLSFARSSILELPSTIVNLKELKLLDLTECKYLCINNGILKSLVNLKELYMSGVKWNVNVEDDELVACIQKLDALEIEFFDKNVLPQNMSFKNLKRFKVSIGCHLNRIEVLRKYSFENTLMLVTNECEQLLDFGVFELFKKTEVLYLQLNGINDLVDCLGASLHNLRVLHINKCTDLKYIFTMGVANSLKHLEHLTIDQCSILETLVESHEICEIEVIRFPALKFLSLNRLPKLMSLCKGDNVIELPRLEELELDSLPNFTSIYQLFLKKEVPKLKTLYIQKMKKLKEIWPSQLSNNDEVMSQLRVINVQSCNSLVNLFPTNPMSLLHHLEKLAVIDCNSIDVIFSIDMGLSCVGEINEGTGSNLRSIEVWNCGELREVWRVKGVSNDLLILGFQNVECIKIWNCDNLRNLYTPITSNFDMKALAEIVLNGDPDMTRNPLLSRYRPYEVVESSQVKEINDMSNMDISKVVDDFLNVVSFPYYLTHTLVLSGSKRVEVVFEIESLNSRKLITTLNNQQPVLPCLKVLTLEGMERMTHVWKYDWNQFLISQQEPISSSFLNLTSIRLLNCNGVKYLFYPLMAKLLRNLNSINISYCDAIEEVVSNIDGEYEEIATSISSYTNTTLFPHLDILDLEDLKSLKCIDGVAAYSHNFVNGTSVHDKFQRSQVGVAYWSFYQHLKTINIERCDVLLNVIPSHAIGEMSKLEELKISDCRSLREIFEIEGINEDVGDLTNKDVGDLTDIGKGNDDMDSAMTKIISLELPNLQVLHIKGCDALKYIFTSSTLELPNLKELHVERCDGLKCIFASSTLELPNLKEVHVERCDGLEYIFASSTLELPNLKEVHVERCDGLEYIFASSTQESLKKLQRLKIENCSAIQVIVKQEHNGLIESKDVVFHSLKSLTLVCLPNLKCFFLGKNKFRWPSLDKVKIYGCPKMMIFTSGVSEALNLKYIHTGVGKHNLECGLNFDRTKAPHEHQLYYSSMCPTSDITEYLQFPWSFSNIIEVDVRFPHKLRLIKTLFPSNELVKVENVGDVEEADKAVFEGTNDETQSAAKDDHVILIPNPKKVMTMDHHPPTSSCIWKVYSFSLPNLTKVSLHDCDNLEHIFSYGTIASLVQLQDLHIGNCRELKVIVEEMQHSQTKAKKVVSFPCLKSLQLVDLPNLKGFCLESDEAFEWPSLDTLKIYGCGEMTIFTKGESTTPKLKVIKTRMGLCEVTEGLNSFIKPKLQEVEFRPLFHSLLTDASFGEEFQFSSLAALATFGVVSIVWGSVLFGQFSMSSKAIPEVR